MKSESSNNDDNNINIDNDDYKDSGPNNGENNDSGKHLEKKIIYKEIKIKLIIILSIIKILKIIKNAKIIYIL